MHLTEILSVWAQLQLGYTHSSISSGAVSISGYSIPLGIFVPVLWHPTPHLFIGAGPIFETELASKLQGADTSKATSFGIQSVVGGYLGGR